MSKNETDQLFRDAPANSWNVCESENFHLRVGPNYPKHGKKDKSPTSLMELVGIDCVSCPKRIDNIASRMQMPSSWAIGGGASAGVGAGTGTSDENIGAAMATQVPSLFIVNVQLPSEFPTSIFKEITDGPGWSLVYYFRWTDASLTNVAATEKNATNTTAKMLAEYMNSGAPVSSAYGQTEFTQPKETPEYAKWKGRFKVILHALNMDEFGLPSFITSYNAKPVLIRNTGTLIKGTNSLNVTDGVSIQYAELDINIHRFASVPKKGLSIILDKFDKMYINTGFCIESREEDEMPETLVGCASLNKPSPASAVPFVFAE